MTIIYSSNKTVFQCIIKEVNAAYSHYSVSIILCQSCKFLAVTCRRQWASRAWDGHPEIKTGKPKGEGFLDSVHITSDKDDNVHFVQI